MVLVQQISSRIGSIEVRVLNVSNRPPLNWLVPDLETVVMSATRPYSAGFSVSLILISSIELKDGNNGMLPRDRLTPIFAHWIPVPRVLHPYPRQRFAANHPRWEPYT